MNLNRDLINYFKNKKNMNNMKKFNMICEILSGELNKRNSIILEHVYFDSLFKDLIKYCNNHLLYSDDLLKKSYNELYDLIDPHWSGKKYLKKNKELYILFYENLNQINWLTENELNAINLRKQTDEGMFCSGFENNPNVGLIIINEIPYAEYKRVLMRMSVKNKFRMTYERGKADGKIEAAIERVEQTLKEKVK